MTVRLNDSFSNIKDFNPIENNKVKIYTCGPTVQSYIHIGNLRAYILSDILKKSLQYIGFEIDDAMNITDVGHLTTDGDEGEDKLEKKSKEENLSINNIIDRYTNYFYQTIARMNVTRTSKMYKASETIDTQIEMIKILEKKGFAYKTTTGVYFDISKFKDYSDLINQKSKDQKKVSRNTVVEDKTKKNAQDFRLWQTAYPEHIMQWDSPWGRGFPGWHIECSAIIYKALGENIDIHTGGIDLRNTHHVNEIAQSKSAFGGEFVNHWIHNGIVLIDGVKMSKSLNNIYKIEDIESKGYNILSLRYLYLNAHYSIPINFTFESLKSAENALNRIYNFIKINKNLYQADSVPNEKYKLKFIEQIENNINTPGMLDVLWGVIRDTKLDISEKLITILDFDRVLSLDFEKYFNIDIPEDIIGLLNKRNILRSDKQWKESDEIRDVINEKGFRIIDLKDKSFVIKNG
jgi:cysteinyl-tRNA synthetase